PTDPPPQALPDAQADPCEQPPAADVLATASGDGCRGTTTMLCSPLANESPAPTTAANDPSGDTATSTGSTASTEMVVETVPSEPMTVHSPVTALDSGPP